MFFQLILLRLMQTNFNRPFVLVFMSVYCMLLRCCVGLLKLLEGSSVNIPDKSRRRGGESNSMTINTSNILFIAAGAFTGINKIIAVRKDKKLIGFGAPANSLSLEAKQQIHNVRNTSYD